MSLTLSQNYTAISPSLIASFFASGGTAPYVYSVLPNGAGGSINSSTGVYTAPATVASNPSQFYDTILVTDNALATAQASILIGTPLLLFCEIIQNQMGLANGRVYLWDQKIFQPQDSGLYVIVSEVTCKPFGNVTEFQSVQNGGLNGVQSINMQSTLDIDIISISSEARDRKEQVLMALGSVYSQQQQEANSFYIARLPQPSKFINLSLVDGAAIPYRYKISINIMYSVSSTVSEPYFDSFASPQVVTNP